MANRLTQQAREVLENTGNPNARLTQEIREALGGPGNPKARLTQVAVEVLARTSGTLASNARLTQIALESLSSGNPHARLTQIAVEVLTLYPPPPALTVSPPPTATTGTAYSGSVTVSGGTAPYTYAITSGPLPPGLSLNSSTGAITGTPTAPGSYPYTVTVTDSFGMTGSASYSIMVKKAAGPSNPADVEFILRRMYVYLRPHERMPVRGG